MVDWAAKQATANRLIAKYGQAATLIKPGATTGPGYAPVAGTPTTYAMTAVDMTSTASEQSGSLIKKTNKLIYVAPSVAAEIEVSDTVTIDGATYPVAKVSPFAPAGTVVYYEVELEG